MEITNLLQWQDTVVIFAIIWIVGNIKKMIPTKLSFLYAYVPLLISITIFVILFFTKIYELKDFFVILKWWVGAIFLYDITIDKIKKIVWIKKDNKNEDTENII